jgi:type IV pilus assembly protein PilY1
MRRIPWIANALLLAGALPSLASAQDTADVRDIKPVIMLLVDTSGSMERLTSSASLPVCANDTVADADQKNRWAVTLEALTGTFNTFACRETNRSTYAPTEMDYGYYLPHFDITSINNQSNDGLLDTYKFSAKFGLMTFDGVGTTLTGESLIPYADWLPVGGTFDTLAKGPQGMYSYGEVRQLVFPGCIEEYAVNSGARNGDGPGGLVSVGSDSDDSIEDVNTAIQDSLKAMRPFGSTPLAAMFEDLRYYFTNNTDVKSGSDPYYQCRGRYAVLLTDSAGDTNDLFRDSRFNCQDTSAVCPGGPGGPCKCPYDEDTEVVRDLVQGSAGSRLLDQLFVVAFNVESATDLSHLDLLAGPTVGAPDCSDPDDCQALRAATPNELKQALAEVIASTATGATSRSVPVRVSNGSSALLNGTQYEITAGFKLGSSGGDPREGLLYRQRIGCDNGAPAEFDLDSARDDLFHVKLNTQADGSRRIRTLGVASREEAVGRIIVTANIDPDADPYTDNTAVNNIAPDGGNMGDPELTGPGTLDVNQSLTASAPVIEVDTGELDPALFNVDLDNDFLPGGPGDRDIIVDYVRGLSRPTKKLADIQHSQPLVLPPLTAVGDSLFAADDRVTAARQALVTEPNYIERGRPGAVFVGTNDGILHAFNLEATRLAGADVDAGFEFWGFVPPALFDVLPSASQTHTSTFEGSPVLAEVSLPRTALSTDPTEIRTVLVSNVRGAPAFVAMDITHPEEPVPLWQYSDKYMGNTVGRAAITHVSINNPSPQLRAVAILPGGSGTVVPATSQPLTSDLRASSGVSRDHGRKWNLEGRGLFVVDVLTGAIIQRFDARHFNAPITGSVVAESPGFGVSKAAYFTDEDGVLWRLSMMNPDPNQWRVQPVYDLFGDQAWNAGRSSTFPPVLTRDDSGNVVIVVGTGNLQNLTDTAAHRVVSLTETRVITDGDIEPANSMTRNWMIQLDPAESVTGPLVLFEEVVYFGTFRSSIDAANVCALGAGSLYGAHYREVDPNDTTLPRPMLAEDSDGDGVLNDPISYTLKVDTAEDTLVLGVSISRDPVCAQGTSYFDPNQYAQGTGTTTFSSSRFEASGPATGGGFQMRAMVGGTGGTQRGGSEIRSIQRNLQVTHQRGVSSWASSVE